MKGAARGPFVKMLPQQVKDALTSAEPSSYKGLFPNALLSNIPADMQRYSVVGLVTESLVLGSQPLTIDSIAGELPKWNVTFDDATKAKVARSKTTAEYLKKIAATRAEIAKETEGAASPLTQGHTLSHECVEGHPDALCGNAILEVKTSSKVEKEIDYFLLQLCSYVALASPTYTRALLVLPLQQMVLAFDLSGWEARAAFRERLVQKAKKLLAVAASEPQDPLAALQLQITASAFAARYRIGHHVSKMSSLLETVRSLPSGIPYQIFLGGTRGTRISLKDEEVAACAQHIGNNGTVLFIHSPYIINLSATTADGWNVKHLGEILQRGAALGAKGVVVHTGKHTSDTYEAGVEKMRLAMTAALEYATPECPLLLETPAGQGTETLQKEDEFLDFVESFHSPALAVCVDTCHVFANGHDPAKYTKAAADRGLLRLVHFNDSQDCCGSCKDRHAMIGAGKIGVDKLKEIAEFCEEHAVPMLVE
jgi:deoxyribonuclease-4